VAGVIFGQPIIAAIKAGGERLAKVTEEKLRR
jgi:hypothetical protein